MSLKHQKLFCSFMPLSLWEATELRMRGGKNIAKVTTKCNNFYGMTRKRQPNNNRRQMDDNNME